MHKIDQIVLYGAVILTGICSHISLGKSGQGEFWSMNIGDTLSILITGVVFFNLTNIIAKRSKKEEAFIELIDKLQQNLNDERIVHIKTIEDIDFVRIRIRKIANIITCMKSMKVKNKRILECLEYVEQKFSNYENMFSNHINDLLHLEKSTPDLQNWIELIDSKCDAMKVEIYK